MSDGPVLVTGATGKQGGAVARALHAAGTPVRALVRDPGAPAAVALTDAGIRVVRGDLDDAGSVVAAARGTAGVFSVQMPDLADLLGDRELRHARSIAAAVREAGVEQVVHTSVSGAGEFGRPGAIDPARWGAHMAHSWRSKAATEDILSSAGARYVTVLRPSGFMENFVPPSPYLAGGDTARFLLALDADRPHPFIAVDDIGRAAAAAFARPGELDGVAVELAGDRLGFRRAAEILSHEWGLEFTLTDGPDQARAEGLDEVFLLMHAFLDAHPRSAGPDDAAALGITVTTLAEWARRRGRPTTLRP